MQSKDGALDPRWMLHGLITGHYVSRAVYAAAKLGIADLLKDGARQVDDLAGATQSHPPSFRRLMLLLASVGLVHEAEAGCFSLTELGRLLRSDVPGSLHSQALLFAGPYQQRAWSRLLESIETGQGGSSQALFTFLAKHPKEASSFYGAMAAKTEAIAGAFLTVYDCSRFSTVVELGAGYGPLLRAILKANRNLRGILFDLPSVAEKAREFVAADGLAARCQVASGTFFESLPTGADAYILKNVIHDWDDGQSVAILSNVARSMARGGSLLLIEMIVPALGEESPWSEIIAASDLNMLVNTGGAERSEAEYRRLFDAAGFELARIIPTDSPWSVLEGRLRTEP